MEVDSDDYKIAQYLLKDIEKIRNENKKVSM